MGEGKWKEIWGGEWAQGLNAFHWELMKEGERGRRSARRGSWRRCGMKGKEVRFSLFSFSNTIKTKLLNSNSFKTFSNFFTKFYKLFKPHTSNQKPCIAK
jgi:hypothetical protein